MKLRCSLSNHAAAPVTLENQGFAFSRCRRCGDDLIRSASASAADWTTVPDGFRVSWRATDLSAFDHRSDTRRLLEATGRSASAILETARLVRTVGGWWIADGARRAKTKMIGAGRSSRRILRLPRREPGNGRLVITFRLTMLRS